jgi:predicted RNA-binding Zn ribbon-like protein
VTRGGTTRIKPWTFHLSGGRPCLDLANTVSWRRSRQPIERLNEYGDLVEWARQSAVLTAADVRILGREARRRPAAAARILVRTRALRETIYRVFSGIAAATQPRHEDLAHLDRELHDALRHLHLTRMGLGGILTWSRGAGLLARPLWIAARSAADVLIADDLHRLKTCPASNCGWVFLDATRSGTRRWCDMQVCGSRAKARSYYARMSRRRSPAPAARASSARTARGRRRRLPAERRRTDRGSRANPTTGGSTSARVPFYRPSSRA